MAIQRTQSGRVDKRTKEYKTMCANLAKARRAQSSSSTSVLQKVKLLLHVWQKHVAQREAYQDV